MISPERFAGAYRVIDVARKTAIVVLFAFIVLSMGVQILMRQPLEWVNGFLRYIHVDYALVPLSMEWTDEILRYINIWVIFLGAGLAVQKREHLHVGLLADRLGGPRGQRIFRAVRSGVIIAGLLTIAVAGAAKAASQARVQTQMAPISIAWFYLAIPVGCILMVIDYLLIVLYGRHPFVGGNRDGEKSAC